MWGTSASEVGRHPPALELRFEPELAELDRLLEDDQIFQHVKADLSQRRPHTTETGRPSTPVEVILRLLVVQMRFNQQEEVLESTVASSTEWTSRPPPGASSQSLKSGEFRPQ
jgi:hypothetical protein